MLFRQYTFYISKKLTKDKGALISCGSNRTIVGTNVIVVLLIDDYKSSFN